MQEQTLHITIEAPEVVEEFTPLGDDMQNASIRDLVRASIDFDVDLMQLTEKTGQKIIRIMDQPELKFTAEPLDHLLGDSKHTALALNGFKAYVARLVNEGKGSKTIKEYANTVQTILKRAINERGYAHVKGAQDLMKQFTKAQRTIIKSLQIADKKAPSLTDDDMILIQAKFDAWCIEGADLPPFKIRADNGKPRTCTHHDMLMLRAAMALGLALNARPAEVLRITIDDVDFINRTVVKRVAKQRDFMHEQNLTVAPVFWPQVMAWVEVLPADESRLFPCAESTFSEKFNGMLKAAIGRPMKWAGLHKMRKFATGAMHDAGVATADIASSGAWQSTEYMEAYLSDRNADNRANRALGAVNAKVAALRGESPLDVKVQMAKNANLVNALMADSARAAGWSEPALFTCKRGPDGTITSEPAVVGSAGIEPAIFAM